MTTPCSPAPAPGPPSAPNQMPPPRRHHDRRDRPRAATPAWASDLPDELLAVLKRMRLPYLRSAAPQVLATARVQRWDPADVLRVLITKEIRGRDGTRRMRRKAAGLPPGKTFDSWREAAGQ